MQVSSAKRLYDRAGAARWGLPLEPFREALSRSAAQHFKAAAPSPADVDRYLGSLHLDDLALACACAAGLEPAWDHFVREFRPTLYRAADAIAPDGGARDLADGLYGDLFGLRERNGERQSLFRYFHGRSSLSTWLRAVLAQRFVDRMRAQRRTEPLIDDERVPAVVRAGGPDDSTCRAAVRAALTEALDQLAARDRLLLGCYYSQGMKLAAIGRMLREHEATVSRHLSRIREGLRSTIEQALRTRAGYDSAASSDCLRSVMSDAGDLDLGALLARSTSEIVHTERDRAAD